MSALLVTGSVVASAAYSTDNSPGSHATGHGGVPAGQSSDLLMAPPVFTTGTFTAYDPAETAVTYDEKLVPEGANVTTGSVAREDGKTSILITVHGFVPNRVYGTHVHVKPCGPSPADAGPHYQNSQDPVQPSVDPKYANPQNEVWLDLKTDAKGSAVSYSNLDWQFTDRHAQSVVIHIDPTATHQGHAGTAGARLACVKHGF
jgi:Cu-Zn family superoxide dismutase